jgi:hypothetical protein
MKTVTVRKLRSLCESILNLTRGLVVAQTREQFQRTYASTYALAQLTHDGLCKPTEEAHTRLYNLVQFLVAEHVRERSTPGLTVK